jgi:hypothetical protein
MSAIFPANGRDVVESAGRHCSSSGTVGSMQKVSFTPTPSTPMQLTVRTRSPSEPPGGEYGPATHP